MVVDVVHHRRRVERVFARHPFIWPQTSGGDDCVFILGRDDLVRAAEPTVERKREPRPRRQKLCCGARFPEEWFKRLEERIRSEAMDPMTYSWEFL